MSFLLYYASFGYYGADSIVTLANGCVVNNDAPLAPNLYNIVTLANGVIVNVNAPKLKEIPLATISPATSHGIIEPKIIANVTLKSVNKPSLDRTRQTRAECDAIESLLQLQKSKLKAPPAATTLVRKSEINEFENQLNQTLRRLQRNVLIK